MRNPFKNPHHTGFISLLLALLGLGTTGCIFFPVMYGSPSAEWSVKGKVVDESGKSVPGLQVVLINHYENSASVIYDQNDWPLDTLRTGTDGSYEAARHGFPLQQLKVEVKDIDGEANGGEFHDASVIVKDFKFEDGDGAWYSGHADINVPDIIVYKKQ